MSRAEEEREAGKRHSDPLSPVRAPPPPPVIFNEQAGGAGQRRGDPGVSVLSEFPLNMSKLFLKRYDGEPTLDTTQHLRALNTARSTPLSLSLDLPLLNTPIDRLINQSND